MKTVQNRNICGQVDNVCLTTKWSRRTLRQHHADENLGNVVSEVEILIVLNSHCATSRPASGGIAAVG